MADALKQCKHKNIEYQSDQVSVVFLANLRRTGGPLAAPVIYWFK